MTDVLQICSFSDSEMCVFHIFFFLFLSERRNIFELSIRVCARNCIPCSKTLQQVKTNYSIGACQGIVYLFQCLDKKHF